MTQIFVSHASHDRSDAERLVATLEKQHVGCWIAPRNIAQAEPWDEAIARGIAACDTMIVLVSGRTDESSYVRNELAMARAKRKRIGWVRVAPVELPDSLAVHLASVQAIEAAPLGEHVEKAAAAILALRSSGAPVAQPQSPPAPRGPAPKPSPVAQEVTLLLRFNILVRLLGIEVDLKARLWTLGESPPQSDDRAIARAWVDEALAALGPAGPALTDLLRRAQDDQRVSSPAAIEQAKITAPKTRALTWLRSFQDTHLPAMLAYWKPTVTKNTSNIRTTYAAQVSTKFQCDRFDEDGWRVMRPTETFWNAVLQWEAVTFSGWRAKIESLLDDRWVRFVREHQGQLSESLGVAVELSLMDRPVEAIRALRLAPPFVVPGARVTDPPKAPDERVDRAALARNASHGLGMVVSVARSALPYAASGLVATVAWWFGNNLERAYAVAIAAVVLVAVGAPLALWARRRNAAQVQRHVEHWEKKAEKDLENRIVSDFNKRLAAHEAELLAILQRYLDQLKPDLTVKASRAIDDAIAQMRASIEPELDEARERHLRLAEELDTLREAQRQLKTLTVGLEVRRHELDRPRGEGTPRTSAWGRRDLG